MGGRRACVPGVVICLRGSMVILEEQPLQLIGPGPTLFDVLSAQSVSRAARVGWRFASWELGRGSMPEPAGKSRRQAGRIDSVILVWLHGNRECAARNSSTLLVHDRLAGGGQLFVAICTQQSQQSQRSQCTTFAPLRTTFHFAPLCTTFHFAPLCTTVFGMHKS